MRVLKLLLPIVILAGGGGAFAYFKVTEEQPEPLRPKDRAPTVSVQRIEKISAAPMVRIFGRVETPNQSVLTAGVEADIIEVSVLEGNAVTRGQGLIVMDDMDTTLEILQRQAELTEIEAMIESDQIKLKSDKSALATERALLALSRKAVERAQKLATSRAGSEATLDDALQNEQRQLLAITQRQQSISDFASRQRQLDARRNKAAAVLKRAERDQSRTRIIAPFDGRVMDVMVSPGDRATRGAQLLRLYDDSQLELRAQIPSTYIPALQQAIDANQPVNAKTISHGREIQLDLHRLSASVAEGQGGVDAFFRSVQGDLPALGVTMEIRLDLPVIDDVVILSPDSIYGRDRVYLVEENQLRSRLVRRLGEIVDDNGRQLLMIEGDNFQNGEQVMKSRLPQAINGLAVKVAP